MFNSSQSKRSIKLQKFFNKCLKFYQPKKGYERKSKNYVVIWSQMYILSYSRLRIESKKFSKVVMLTSQIEDMK